MGTEFSGNRTVEIANAKLERAKRIPVRTSVSNVIHAGSVLQNLSQLDQEAGNLESDERFWRKNRGFTSRNGHKIKRI